MTITSAQLEDLSDVVAQLVAPGKGILAADESPPTIEQRFAQAGIANTWAQRQAWRELLFTAPGIETYLGGVILSDEALHQATGQGKPFVELLAERGVIPGVKVDRGGQALAGFPGEKVTEGIDGLRSRLHEYASLGARFTKWRAVATVGRHQPTATSLSTNCELMARFAALSQEAGLVPMVEPEVLMDGDHSIERCAAVTDAVLRRLYTKMRAHRVPLEGTILKVNMVLPGHDHRLQPAVDEVARQTLRVLRDAVPAVVPAVVFLSGGQDPADATARLNAIASPRPQPWVLSFSFARALQGPALEIWKGQGDSQAAAQSALLQRAWLNSLARDGRYTPTMETEHPPVPPGQTGDPFHRLRRVS